MVPEPWLHGLWAACTVCCVLVALGALYRLAIWVFNAVFTYFFLLDQVTYLNHFYMIILFGVLLGCTGAHRCWSLDRRLGRVAGAREVPAWNVLALAFQIEVILVFAGLVKIEVDWLRGEPLRQWMLERTWSPLSALFEIHWITLAAPVLVIVLHVVGAPLLLWSRTRLWVFLAYCAFHVANAHLFVIGVFPWLTIAATTIVFPADWPSALARRAGGIARRVRPPRLRVPSGLLRTWSRLAGPPAAAQPEPAPVPPLGRAAFGALLLFAAVQTLVPLRSFLYEGPVWWTEKGQQFAWRMMMYSAAGDGGFLVVSPGGDAWMVPPGAHLDPVQSYQVLTKPEVLLHFVGKLAEHHAATRPRRGADPRRHLEERERQALPALRGPGGGSGLGRGDAVVRRRALAAAPGAEPGGRGAGPRLVSADHGRAVRRDARRVSRSAALARHRGRRARCADEAPHAGGRRAMSRTGLLAPWRAAVLALLVAASATAAEPAGTQVLALTLEEAIRLALANNRSLERARLGREADRLSLEVAEERYRPRASVDASARTDNRRPGSMELSAGPRMRVPTGGEFSLRWSEPVGGGTDGSGTWTLGFSQPLLRGFGPAVDTAPVRLARIREKMNVLAFRDTVAGTIESVIQAYRSVVRQHRSVAISRGALDRARKQLQINRSLIQAGRMAARETIQSEAEIANRELSLVESENSLNSANAALLAILDLDGVSRVVPLDETLEVETLRPDLRQSIETAFANRTDYLETQLRTEVATIALNRDAQRPALGSEVDGERVPGKRRRARLWRRPRNERPAGRAEVAHARADAGEARSARRRDRARRAAAVDSGRRPAGGA